MLPSGKIRAVGSAAESVAKAPLLRPARFSDYEKMAALQVANGLSVKPRNEWVHLWKDNPAYRTLPSWCIGWILESEDSAVVGTVESIPCLYRLAGKTYVGTFGRGWAVDPKYRGHSLRLIFVQFQGPNIDIRLTSTAGPVTAALLTKRGWMRVPSGRWDSSAFWVTSYTQVIPRYLTAQAGRLASTVLSPLLYPALRVTDWISNSIRTPGLYYELTWLAEFDNRFDEFWAELEHANPTVLLSIRDRETLAWHFKYAIEAGRLWILTASKGPRIVAYSIFERRPAQFLGLERMLLIDFQTIAPARDFGSAMLSCALKRCREEDVPILENIGCWFEAKHPQVPRAPHRRGLENWTFIYKAATDPLRQRLADEAAWYPTQYDTDASL